MKATYYSLFESQEYGSTLANRLDADLLPFSALNIALMGDSITHLASPNSWVEHFDDRSKYANINNLSRSGATWSHTSETVYDITSTGGDIAPDNVIWNQYNRLVAGIAAETMVIPNVIFIFAGTNDIQRTIGDLSTEFASGTTILDKAPGTHTNICKAARFVIENIWSSWPNCQVILATPMQKGIADNTTIFAIGDAIEGCGKYLSIPVIRTDKELGMYGFKELNANYFTYDKLHPSEVGALLLGKFFTKKINGSILV